ncbi:lipid IV(A) 3-deoxy-D-manno-octulosonic acid transferase [Rhizobium sp. PAMB 3174]
MTALLARLFLSAYQWAGSAAYPVMGPYLSYRARKGKEDAARRNERFGFASAPRPQGPLVWCHAASVGETLAIIPLIRELRRRDIHVVLTSGTTTSAALIASRLKDEVIHQYVPLDMKPAVRRFLDYWHPDAALVAESEIWPVICTELKRRQIPQILINARISDRSFDRWRRRPAIAELLFEGISLAIAQSDIDAERYHDLGVQNVIVSGNLKVDTDAPPVNQQLFETYSAQIGDRKTWAAISTFEGEEAAAADVHLAIRARNNQLSIIVPRHPDRADAVEAMLVGKGLTVARRSRNDVITPQTDIFLGDTIGEMGLYLRLTQVTFVGRSLYAEGGQNPLEPAMLGSAVLSGAHVQNFRDAYQRLVKSGGARLVRDTEMLTKAVNYLLNNEPARQKMIEAGHETVQRMRGALPATIKGLTPYITPLAVQARLMPRAS